MTLNTKVYIHDHVDYLQVFVKCSQLLGADEGVRFKQAPGMIMNVPGQGMPAWLTVYHYDDGPETDNWGGSAQVKVSFDTAYGYSGPDGGCGGLHARLVAELGRWLDGKGATWSWLNEWTGEIYQGHDGLAGLGGGL